MKRHDLDLTSLVSGAIFVVVGIVFLLDLTADYSVKPRWVIPLVLIGVGVAGLLSTVKAGRRDDEPVATGDDDSADD
jgi:F0F1-type ATP synthase assembly protein I